MTTTDAPLCIGIDIGTSRSVVAVWEDDRARIVPSAEGATHTPSMVSFDHRGEPIVGVAAQRLSVLHPQRTFYGFKHLFGLVGRTVAVDGRHWSPEDLAALILGKLKADTERWTGRPVTQAVLTAPIAFGLEQRRALVHAARTAGIEVLRVVDEPVAVALALQRRLLEEDATFLVFDLGAGTLDISVVEVGSGVYEVKSVAGDTHLGGADVDTALAHRLSARFAEEAGITLEADPVAWQRLVLACEQAKIDLTSVERTTLALPQIARDADGVHHLEVEINRAEAAAASAEIAARCRALCRQAATDAGLSLPSDEIRPLLAGGGSRTFWVADLVADTCGQPVDRGISPDEAIAEGAALWAAVLKGVVKDTLLLHVTATGTRVRWGDRTEELVARNTTVPTRVTCTLTAPARSDRHQPIFLLQGDAEVGQAVDAIAAVTVDELGGDPRSRGQVEVTVTIGPDDAYDLAVADLAARDPRVVHLRVDAASARRAHRLLVEHPLPAGGAERHLTREGPVEPTARHVFISYSREDSDYVGHLVEGLSRAGITCWWDVAVEVGEQSTIEIARHLTSSAAVVAVMSVSAERSSWMARELHLAEDAGIPVLPLLLNGAPIFQLRNLQYEEVGPGRMPSERFVTRVRSLCREGS